MRVLAILAAIPLLALAVLILAWAQTPIAESLAAPVGAGFGDAERAVGLGCGLALAILAGGASLIGLAATPILLAQRRERAQIVAGARLEWPVGARTLPPPPIEGNWYEVTQVEEASHEQHLLG